MIKAHPLKGPNRLKLGVFSANADGGLAITDVPERWLAGWEDNLTAAQIADRAGLEFVLPIARWKGFGGKNRVREWSFETFTWAAGLAAATEHIGLFMTVHVPLVHPLYAAKSLATVDHISQGRAGLNIVCGWNPKEFGMFGTPLVEKGYDQAAEWIEIVERLYASDEPFDHRRHLLPAQGRGQPAGQPAAAAPGDHERRLRRAGPRFRGRPIATICSRPFPRSPTAGKHVADIGERADKAGPQGRRLHGCACRLPRDAWKRREAYYDRYAVTMADHDAVDAHMAGKKEFSQSHDSDAYDRYRQRFAGGAGTYPLIGTPENDRRGDDRDRRAGLCRASRCPSSTTRRNCRISATACCRC